MHFLLVYGYKMKESEVFLFCFIAEIHVTTFDSTIDSEQMRIWSSENKRTIYLSVQLSLNILFEYSSLSVC